MSSGGLTESLRAFGVIKLEKCNIEYLPGGGCCNLLKAKLFSI